MELVSLTTPVISASITDYHIVRIDLNRKEQRLFLVAESNTGKVIEFLESGQTALDTMVLLNKANLTVKSLERRALEYMQTKGAIGAGSITGSPD